MFLLSLSVLSRFELGSGAALLRTASPVTLNQLHTVVAKRTKTEGSLKLDDFPEVPASSKGKLTSLDLDKSPIILGYINGTMEV